MLVVAMWEVEMVLAYILWVFVSASGYHTASVVVCIAPVLSIALNNICLVFIFAQMCRCLKTEKSL